MSPDPNPQDLPFRRARAGVAPRLRAAAAGALEAALDAGLKDYDRRRALARFHRLTPETVAAETPQAARAVLRELQGALRAERARIGHWSYDLNRHIGLLVAWRAEKARCDRILRAAGRRPGG